MPLADLARALMDTPRWVETRFMLLRGEAVVRGLSGDRRRFVAASTRWPVMAVVGAPDAAFIAESAARAESDVTVLCAEEHADHVAAALPGWRRNGAAIHAWPGGTPLPEAPPASEARLLRGEELEALGHVPPVLRDGLLNAGEYAPVAGAFAGGAPVAFCYASAVTESLWDVSIDTLDGYRRRGLASKAFLTLAAELGRSGKWPVWGSADDNEASRRLAERLGFVPAERLALFEREGG